MSDAPDRMFRAFADPTRLRLLGLLAEGELCVCDLVDALALPQPRVSRHLSYLRAAGLVDARREGTWRYYALRPAAGRLHRGMLACLRGCFGDVPALRRDRARLKDLKKKEACR